MRLQQIQAVAHPDGNRIDLSWSNPDLATYPSVRIMRGVGTHPALDLSTGAPQQQSTGTVVADIVVDALSGEPVVIPLGTAPTVAADTAYSGAIDLQTGASTFHDVGLVGETVYYYTLYPFGGEPPTYRFDRTNRTAARTTEPYALAARLYEWLPGIYYRYDATLPPATPNLDPKVRAWGQLRRFLELPGGQLDQFYSAMHAALALHNVAEVEGALLPLLAAWIGWDTNFRLELDAQRNEIRNAPHLYQTIGIVPTVEATVKRILDWDSRTKEFVHNVFRTNTPERLNLWESTQQLDGTWSVSTAPLSLDDAFDGRAAVVPRTTGAVELIYHTLRHGRGMIRRKVRTASGVWQPNNTVTLQTSHDRHPTAVQQGMTDWIFWNVYAPETQQWRIDWSRRAYAADPDAPEPAWSDAAPLMFAGDPTPAPPRKRPWAVVDNSDPVGLWLFWLEQTTDGWRAHYNRHDGTSWSLATPVGLPPAADAADPRVQDDLFATMRAVDDTLWLFWARQMPTGVAGQTRWQIAYRVKSNLALDATGWSAVRTLPDAVTESDAREPFALVNSDGNLDLFWSANTTGSWSIWHGVLDADNHSWQRAPAIVTGNPYNQRSPSAFWLGAELHLVYRANDSVTYTSSVYGATETFDARYAGATTVHAGNKAKIALRGRYEDFQTYTYDTGQNGRRGERNWYARDTVGMYLTPNTDDPSLIVENRNLLERALRKFLPINVRTVFIIEPGVHEEALYPDDSLPRDGYRDALAVVAREALAPINEGHSDTAPEWVWLESWPAGDTDHGTVDTTAAPIDRRTRTRHTGIDDVGSPE